MKAAEADAHFATLQRSLVETYKAASKRAMDHFVSIHHALSWGGWCALSDQTEEFEREKLFATREAVAIANSAVLFLDGALRLLGEGDPKLAEEINQEIEKTCGRITETSFAARCCDIGKMMKDPRVPYAAASILARAKDASGEAMPEKAAEALILAASLDGHTGPIEDFAPRWHSAPIRSFKYFGKVFEHLSADATSQ